MSAVMASSTDPIVVFVRLLGEDIDVWRPVQAERLSESTFRLSEQAIPQDETWSFQPGDIVVAEERADASGGPEQLVAIARARDFDEPSRRVLASVA